jgi:hypothetical protein
MTPPRFNNEEAVAAFIWKIIDEEDEDAEREFYALPWDTHPDIWASDLFRSAERKAIEAAHAGNFKPLADLVDRNPMLRRTRHLLSPEAWALLAARVAPRPRARYKKGEPRPPPRPKVNRGGRPRQTIDERMANTPVHQAAAEIKRVEEVLRRHYPTEKKIRDLAITMVAGRAGIEPETLTNHVRKHGLP